MAGLSSFSKMYADVVIFVHIPFHINDIYAVFNHFNITYRCVLGNKRFPENYELLISGKGLQRYVVWPADL